MRGAMLGTGNDNDEGVFVSMLAGDRERPGSARRCAGNDIDEGVPGSTLAGDRERVCTPGSGRRWYGS
jgi:hypothetical protein